MDRIVGTVGVDFAWSAFVGLLSLLGLEDVLWAIFDTDSVADGIRELSEILDGGVPSFGMDSVGMVEGGGAAKAWGKVEAIALKADKKYQARSGHIMKVVACLTSQQFSQYIGKIGPCTNNLPLNGRQGKWSIDCSPRVANSIGIADSCIVCWLGGGIFLMEQLCGDTSVGRCAVIAGLGGRGRSRSCMHIGNAGLIDALLSPAQASRRATRDQDLSLFCMIEWHRVGELCGVVGSSRAKTFQVVWPRTITPPNLPNRGSDSWVSN